jgi:hypothetical protein
MASILGTVQSGDGDIARSSSPGRLDAQRGEGPRHGAKLKRCSHEGCVNFSVKVGEVYLRHGAKLKRCSREGCSNQVQKGGVCIRHGAKLTKLKRCSHEGCTNNAIQ